LQTDKNCNLTFIPRQIYKNKQQELFGRKDNPC